MVYTTSELTYTERDFIDGRLDVVSVLKKDYRNQIEGLQESKLEGMVNGKKKTTVYHGTSTYYVFDILKKGILSRYNTGNSNWERYDKLSKESLRSISKLLYVTD